MGLGPIHNRYMYISDIVDDMFHSFTTNNKERVKFSICLNAVDGGYL